MEERLIALLRLAIMHHANPITLMFNGNINEMSINMFIDGEQRKVYPKFDDYKLFRFLLYYSGQNIISNSIAGKNIYTSVFCMKIDNTNLLLNYTYSICDKYESATITLKEVQNG